MRKAVLALVLTALIPLQAQALSTDDLLALVAMPLAVAAVSDLTGVPENDLASLVATLNNAAVPPVQFVEVIRYVPVALAVDAQRADFVQFVRTQSDQGVRGTALVTAIEQRLRTIEPDIVIASRPATQTIIVDDTFIPAPVRTRVAKRRDAHPHGGPPGQLKKELGLKTGAEVVNRSRPMISASDKDDDDDKGRGRGKQKSGKDNNKGQGKSQGKDKGKGKG